MAIGIRSRGKPTIGEAPSELRKVGDFRKTNGRDAYSLRALADRLIPRVDQILAERRGPPAYRVRDQASFFGFSTCRPLYMPVFRSRWCGRRSSPESLSST